MNEYDSNNQSMVEAGAGLIVIVSLLALAVLAVIGGIEVGRTIIGSFNSCEEKVNQARLDAVQDYVQFMEGTKFSRIN